MILIFYIRNNARFYNFYHIYNVQIYGIVISTLKILF